MPCNGGIGGHGPGSVTPDLSGRIHFRPRHNGTAPEAGVWVIAETKETNTPFIKIVVTDDQGRFTLPQLPERDLQRLGTWLWPAGLGEGQGPPRRHRARTEGRNRQGLRRMPPRSIPATTGCHCWRCRLPASFPARAPGPAVATASSRPSSARTTGCIASRRTATSATSSATRSPARWRTWISRSWASSRTRTPGFTAPRSACAAAHAGRLPAVRRGGHGEDDGRLDARGGSWRSAAHAAAAAGHRTQRRRHAVGHRRSAGFHARRNRHRQEQAHRECLRPDLRRIRRPRHASTWSIRSPTIRTRS